ncbi:MAG: hypothetical protein ABI721_05075 [Candidatus Dojkabacteria bacterium]
MFRFKVWIRITTFILIGSLIISTLLPRSANALVISPPIIDLNIDRSQSYSGEFSVIFKQDDPSVFYLYLKKLDFEDFTNNQITTDPLPDEQTLANWTVLENTSVNKPEVMGVVNGDNVVPVKYTVSIPADAPPGAHYAQIIVSQKSPEELGPNSQVSLGAEVGYQILVNLKGDRDYDTKLVSFKLKGDVSILPTLPASFETTFQNDGNVYVTPNANIEIFAGGTKIDNITLNSKFYRIFPGKTKTYQNTWSEENIEELQDQAQIDSVVSSLPKDFMSYVSYEVSHFRIGIYNADLGGFAGAQAPFKSSVTFIVIPYHLLLVLLGLVVLFYIVYRLGKRGSDSTKRKKVNR